MYINLYCDDDPKKLNAELAVVVVACPSPTTTTTTRRDTMNGDRSFAGVNGVVDGWMASAQKEQQQQWQYGYIHYIIQLTCWPEKLPIH